MNSAQLSSHGKAALTEAYWEAVSKLNTSVRNAANAQVELEFSTGGIDYWSKAVKEIQDDMGQDVPPARFLQMVEEVREARSRLHLDDESRKF